MLIFICANVLTLFQLDYYVKSFAYYIVHLFMDIVEFECYVVDTVHDVNNNIMYMCIYIYVYVYLCVCMYVCVCMYMYMDNIKTAWSKY